MTDIQKILQAIADKLDATDSTVAVSIMLKTIVRTLDGVSSYSQEAAVKAGLGVEVDNA